MHSLRSLCALSFFLVSLAAPLAAKARALEIRSDVFDDRGYIPSQYTGDSLDISPPLAWTDVPAHTKSFVLICDDPDAPRATWVHWVIFNIPGDADALSENVPKRGVLGDGTAQGRNDFGRIGYGGPSPPPGRPHRYFFKIYALDIELPLEAGATKSDVEAAADGHILAKAELMGLYARSP